MKITKQDFEIEIKKQRHAILENLQALIRIDSSVDHLTRNASQPLGAKVKEAGLFLLNLAQQNGFKTENYDNYAYGIVMGPKSATYTATINHLDVVPVDNKKWTFEAFAATYRDGFLYGRGTQDDKGPTIAVFYAMKILQDLGYKLTKTHKLILGTNEENDLIGIDYFNANYPSPVAAFTADAEFPGVNSEKGDIRGCAYLPFTAPLTLKGGEAINIVISAFEAEVDWPLPKLAAPFESYLKTHQLQGTLTANGATTIIRLDGHSAHGSLPEQGVNAGTHMSAFLTEFYDVPALQYIHKFFHKQFTQAALEGHFDETNGAVSVNVGRIRTAQKFLELHLDIRFAKGVSASEIKETWSRSLQNYFKETIKIVWSKPSLPLYYAPNTPLVQLLYQSFQNVTNRHDALVAIGGSTYAKEFPNCIAFGGAFREETLLMHAEDEKVEFQKLLDSIPIYAEAILQLNHHAWKKKPA